MKTALVTGGAGFIGNHLSRRLLADGWRVLAMDDLTTGQASNVAGLDPAKFKLVVGDIRHDERLALLVDEADVIFHLAASVGVRRVVQYPAETLAVNISGTEVVLALAKKKKKLTLIFSSSEVYGKRDSDVFSRRGQAPFCERDDLVLGPSSIARWGYAASKLVDEFLALAYHQEYGVPVIVARLFNTTGPGQLSDYGMVVPSFCRAALAGEPLVVHGDGQQTRCFCHVQDTIQAIVQLAAAPSATVGHVINIGNPQEVTMQELATRVVQAAQSKSEVKFVPYAEVFGSAFEDMRRRVPCLCKIESLVGWRPQRGLDEIIIGTLAALQ